MHVCIYQPYENLLTLVGSSKKGSPLNPIFTNFIVLSCRDSTEHSIDQKKGCRLEGNLSERAYFYKSFSLLNLVELNNIYHNTLINTN